MNPNPTSANGTLNSASGASATAAATVPAASQRGVQWRTRYDGLVAIAYVGDKAVAGISGPWTGQFALTWWERPLPARQLELYDSLDDAKREVEAWALRMRTGFPSLLRDMVTAEPAVASKTGLLDQVRALLPDLSRRRGRDARENIERVRQLHAGRDADVANLHFAAYE